MGLKRFSSSTLVLMGVLSGLVLAEVPVVESLPTVEIAAEVAPSGEIESTNNEQPANRTAHFLHQIEALRKRNMTLEGRVEELEFQLRQNESEFRDRYLDLDARISRLMGAASNTVDNGLAKNEAGAKIVLLADLGAIPSQLPEKSREDLLVEREQVDYKSAYSLIREKEFDQALIALRKLLKDYPRGQLSDNAQYWLGEVLMAQGKYEPARDEFKVVMAQYPESSKVPDSAYKLGRLLDLLGNEVEARRYLESVVSQYPGSSAARLSDTYLQNM